MDQRIICIIANRRAGTTALQRAIELTGAAINYGEIFKVDADESGGRRRRFLEFVRENDIRLADALLVRGASAIVKRYLDWLKEGAGSKHVVIDVKFDAWFAISPAWQYPHEEPFFLRQLKQARAVLLFVWRESLADQILSNAISDELGIWHYLDAKKAGGRKFEVQIEKVERLAMLICRSEADMFRHIRNYANKIVVKYEDLFEDGDPSPDFADAFKKLTGIEFARGQKGGIRPNSVPKDEIITNYDEAVATINKIAAKHRSRLLLSLRAQESSRS
jgi:hypothetical protein